MNQNLNPVQRKQKATILTKRDPLNIPNRDTRARDQATIFKAGKKNSHFHIITHKSARNKTQKMQHYSTKLTIHQTTHLPLQSREKKIKKKTQMKSTI